MKKAIGTPATEWPWKSPASADTLVVWFSRQNPLSSNISSKIFPVPAWKLMLETVVGPDRAPPGDPTPGLGVATVPPVIRATSPWFAPPQPTAMTNNPSTANFLPAILLPSLSPRSDSAVRKHREQYLDTQ